jgi:hypothetical protein
MRFIILTLPFAFFETLYANLRFKGEGRKPESEDDKVAAVSVYQLFISKAGSANP